MIEELLFGQAVFSPHTHTHKTPIHMRAHVHSHTQTHNITKQICVKDAGVNVNGHVAREQILKGSSICIVHVHAPPVPANHVSDSTDLLAHEASVSVCVSQCV